MGPLGSNINSDMNLGRCARTTLLLQDQLIPHPNFDMTERIHYMAVSCTNNRKRNHSFGEGLFVSYFSFCDIKASLRLRFTHTFVKQNSFTEMMQIT